MRDINKENKKDTLIFLHIPKTAGSTFHGILEKHYGLENTFSIDGLHPDKSISEFKEMPASKRCSVDLVKGHMLFGLHECIPRPCTYITFLRDPVERVVSYYYYVCRFPEHYLYDIVVGKKMSLKQFVESGLTTELYDFQVKLLSGEESAFHSRQYDDSLLAVARNNIEHFFPVVGLTEYFDQSLLLLQYYLGWKFTPYYKRLNVTTNRVKIDTIDQDIIECIRKKNELDCSLYDWALSQFQKQLRDAKISEEKVRKFRRLNQQNTLTVLRKLNYVFTKISNSIKDKLRFV